MGNSEATSQKNYEDNISVSSKSNSKQNVNILSNLKKEDSYMSS